MTTTPHKQRPGAVAADGNAHRKKFPWWLLLLALLALGLLLWLLSRGGDDGAAQDQSADTNATAENGDDTAASGSGDGSGDSAAAAGSGNGAGAAGKITAGSATIYPSQGNSAAITQYTGDDAVGKGVTVESVVSDEGFWVGDANDRVFVHLKTGGDESGPQVKAGDKVDFEGSVKAHDGDYAQSLGVEGNEGAQELTEQGAHIEVPEVAISDQ